MRLLCVLNAAFVRVDAQLYMAHTAIDFLVELAEAAGNLRIAHSVIEPGADDTLADAVMPEHPRIEMSGFEWWTGGVLARAFSYVRALPWVFAEVSRCDFLYAFLPGHLPLLYIWAARVLRKPYGVYLRGELGEARLRSSLGSARFVTAPADWLCNTAERFCPNTGLIRPMMDAGLDDLVEGREHRARGPWRLLFVGRVERAKGIEELIDAARLLRERGVTFRFDVVGGGPGGDEMAQLKRRAREAGLDEVVFHGLVPDKPGVERFYREADLFVLPTHHEGFARVLWEAMIYGVPILTTFVGGIPAVMRDGVDSLRIPVRDAAGLAAAIERALDDVALRRRIAEGASRRVREILSVRDRSHAQLVVEKLAALSGSSRRA